MPSVKVKTNAGSLHINYTISTPTNPTAKSIEKNIPTIIFLHPVYMGQEIYHRTCPLPLRVGRSSLTRSPLQNSSPTRSCGSSTSL